GDRVVFGANLAGGRSAEVLFEAGRGGVRALVHGGERVGRTGRLVDLFGSSLDDLARASVAGSCVAFETSLTGVGGSSGIVALDGGPRIVARVGQHAPGGGAYREFGTPAVGGGCQVVFVARAGTSNTPSLFRAGAGGSRRLAAGGDETRTRVGGTYRAMPSGPCTQVLPPLATVVAVGMPATPASTFLGFGVPSGNRRGAVAFTADLTGAGPTDAVLVAE